MLLSLLAEGIKSLHMLIRVLGPVPSVTDVFIYRNDNLFEAGIYILIETN